MALGNLGDTLTKLKRYREALEALNSAHKIFVEIQDPAAEATTLLNLAEAHYRLNDLSLAKQFCDRSLKIGTRLQIPLVKECQELQAKLTEPKE